MREKLEEDLRGATVKVSSIREGGIELDLNGENFFIPFDHIPSLRGAKVEDLFDVKMSPAGWAVMWEKLEAGLEVEALRNPEKFNLTME
jgi:hypothetical protein